jgi:hypothetical protein
MVFTKKRRPWNRAGRLALVAGIFLLLPGFQGETDRYRNFDDMTEALRRVVRAHSDMATMESIGQTLEGRDIWVVEIANRSGTPVDERPGLLLAANFEGDLLVGSELAVHTVEYLLNNYSSDPDVQDRLDNHVLYVLPRVNPDAAEMMFANVKSGRRRNMKPYDDDNDAMIDEDGVEDLNGDGQITLMRVADPSGPYMVHPDDARLMKEAEAHKGESGAFSLYWEGIDNDGDGFYNEDGLGGVDLNRNFQHEYPYNDADAGAHMISELESRAIMDFMISHRNIAMVMTFGESDNLVSSPTSGGAIASPSPLSLHGFAEASYAAADTVGTFPISVPGRGRGFGMGFFRGGAPAAPRPLEGRQPNKTVNRSDLEYFNAVGEEYREITGIEKVAATRAPKGAFFEYAYFQFGVPAFSTPGWGISEGGEDSGDEAAPQTERQRPSAPSRGAAPAMGRMRPGGGQTSGSSNGADLALLNWMDAEGVDGFVDWTEFQHPTLGTVEIGGFKRYASGNPPVSELAVLGESHAQFAVHLMSLFADVSIADVAVTSHGGGVFEIKAEIENSGYLPTSMRQGVTARSVAPTMVQLDVPPEDVLTGAAKTSFFQALDGSGSRQTYVWVIRGRQGAQINLTVRSQKSGHDTATITLR